MAFVIWNYSPLSRSYDSSLYSNDYLSCNSTSIFYLVRVPTYQCLRRLLGIPLLRGPLGSCQIHCSRCTGLEHMTCLASLWSDWSDVQIHAALAHLSGIVFPCSNIIHLELYLQASMQNEWNWSHFSMMKIDWATEHWIKVSSRSYLKSVSATHCLLFLPSYLNKGMMVCIFVYLFDNGFQTHKTPQVTPFSFSFSMMLIQVNLENHNACSIILWLIWAWNTLKTAILFCGRSQLCYSQSITTETVHIIAQRWNSESLIENEWLTTTIYWEEIEPLNQLHHS